MNESPSLLQSLLDPDESKRVSAVSDLLYGIENVTRVIALALRGLAEIPTYKGNFEVMRELFAATSTVDNITTQLEAHWIALHLHRERIEQTQKGAEKQTDAEPSAVVLH